MIKAEVAVAGFIGGIAPSLAEFVSLCKNESMPHFTFFIGAVVMGLMGMAVVSFAKEVVPWKGFTQGMGAPAIFSSATTAATSIAFLMVDPFPAVYADSALIMDSIPKMDSVVVFVDDSITGKRAVGSMIILEKDSLFSEYKVPDKDTIRIKTKIYDPIIRRSIIQGLMPLQNNLTKQFERRLLVKE